MVRGEDRLLTLEKKKKEKEYKGGKFLTVYWRIQSLNHNHSGNFHFTNIPLFLGACNVNDPEDLRVKFEADKYISVKLSSFPELAQKFFLTANKAFTKQINALVANGDIDKPLMIKDLIRTGYSNKNKEKKGQLREDPLVDFKLEWGDHPSNYFKSTLAGKPKMTIKDATREVLKDDGSKDYAPAVIVGDNGEPTAICRDNAHLFITNSSLIADMSIFIGTCFTNDIRASMPFTVVSMVIKHVPDTGAVRVSDDDDFEFFDNDGSSVPVIIDDITIAGNNDPTGTL